MKMSKHHQMMVDDGLPTSLVLTPEQREEAWRSSPPRPMPKFAEVTPKNEERDVMPNAKGEKTVAEMTKEYNAIADTKGLKQIVLFKDRATAQRRLKEIQQKVAPTSKEPKQRLKFNHGHGAIVEEFNFRYGSEREKLLHILLDDFEKMVPRKKLGKLVISISGITWRIDNKKLAYELREGKSEGEISYGLFRKVHT